MTRRHRDRPHRLVSYDALNNVAWLEHRGSRICVDTSNLENALEFTDDALLQFIGEIAFDGKDELKLRARVGRDVAGLDVGLWERALRLHRDHASVLG